MAAQNSTGWILSVAARSKCLRCGQGRLSDGFLTFAKKYDVCGLDYSFADTADGPAFFAMIGMGVPVTAFGIWIELAYEPPLWVHAVTTLPFLLVACILPLRFLKGALAAAQYVNRAEEGRLAKSQDRPKP
jgi:uncharacterized protein (DUF983 family)